jgi:D-psicose/D-tagatose/L-ribulose 3-epimerase
MRFGVNLMLFGDDVDRSVLERLGQIADIGFDGVEVPVFRPELIDTHAIRRAAGEHGLELTASSSLPAGTRLYGSGPAARKAAENHVLRAIAVAAELGSPVLAGPLYKAVGDVDDEVPLPQQRRRVAEALAPLAEAADECGVTIALEPLNRFETNFLNTVEDALGFAQSVGGAGVGLLLDTFHMHIEESDSGAAICRAAAAGLLTHFHASENDRGIAGSGQVQWRRIAAALAGEAYDRWVVLETFNQDNQAIRRAVSCWRPFYPDEEEFMRQGLSFMHDLFAGVTPDRAATA